MSNKKLERFSFSKLNTFKNCPWQYKTRYIDKVFIDAESINIYLGLLVHWTEEHISRAILRGEKPEYDFLKENFATMNVPKKSKFDREGGVFGTDIIKQRYKKEFFDITEDGSSYMIKCKEYLAKGIYRQEKFLQDNLHLELCAVELPFEFTYNNRCVLYGFIDRVYKYKNENKYIIDDIKTRIKPFEHRDLTTPLQHLIYGRAIKEMFNLEEEPEEYFYDLPFISMRQQAGTKGFIKRGYTQLNKLLDQIEQQDYAPNPTPLCHWCDFSLVNPDLSEKGKAHGCPYTSLWTREDRNFNKLYEWRGEENHQAILNAYYSGEPIEVSSKGASVDLTQSTQVKESEKKAPQKKKFNFKF